MNTATGRRIPLATYRLQLRREFPFDAAAGLAPYARALGISDFYCSPVFLSTPGSAHGYDVNDYRRINPDLGGRAGLERLDAAVRKAGMSILLDFVPNHMGINGPGLLNRWWRDVLKNGIHSPYARFFDIDWNDGDSPERSQVLVPILDDHYGRVLEAGRLALVYDQGELSITYAEMRFPLAPSTYARLLEAIGPSSGEPAVLSGLAEAFATLPKPDATEEGDAAQKRTGQLDELKRRLAALLETQPATRRLVDDQLRRWNGVAGDPASFDELEEILEQQHYRLAYWKAGVHETNYRRFFAIDTLIGLRVEIPEVFEETHALLAELIRDGIVTGLRIDHIDGLRDPQQYLDRLQTLAANESEGVTGPLYVVVEKILAENEALPPAWATHGTTGYEFIAQLSGVLVDLRSERLFTATYKTFCEDEMSFEDVAYAQKKRVLDEMFANAVTRLATDLTSILQADRRWRDVTRHELTVAVREVMAGYGVYRTYRRGTEPMNDRDRRIVEQACALALRRNQRLGPQPFEILRDVLMGVYPSHGSQLRLRETLAEWVLSFQQYTGAVMAKSVEDTAFYTYSRLIALNEVGGDPGRFGGTITGFHTANAERARVTPHALITTATHDTKLGEDVRARLYALSEIPHEWNDSLTAWREMNQRHKTTVDGRSAPDAGEEYRLYQVLLGVWPADDVDPTENFRARVREHWKKAVSEARQNTTWIQPNEAWLEAGDRFIDGILDMDTGREFLAAVRPVARRLAHLGMVNSLTQVVLKSLSPGIPDFYQGSELWELSLVDPDNRRPVDFTRRQELAQVPLESLRWEELLREWRTGEIKLQLTRALLSIRGEYADVLQAGDYRPLETTGRFAENVVAFARSTAAGMVVVVVPRLTSRLGCPPLGLVWDDTAVVMPNGSGKWRDGVTGNAVESTETARVAELFATLPLAVLIAVRGGASEERRIVRARTLYFGQPPR